MVSGRAATHSRPLYSAGPLSTGKHSYWGGVGDRTHRVKETVV